MEYTKLGSTGLDVSPICLGCMSFGVADRGNQPWALNEDDSRALIRRALDAGVNFFDTANVYSLGSSEEFVGRALGDFARRDDVVVATKVHHRMRPGPNGMGLSRKAIMFEIDKSLRRLGMDYVDLYQIHRYDAQVPIDETMQALHDVVKAGKARYIGASAMWAWQFAKAQHAATGNGWTRFVTMTNHYNLLYREEEREMLPLCVDQGVASIPWSTLAVVDSRAIGTRRPSAAGSTRRVGGSTSAPTARSSSRSHGSPPTGACHAPRSRWRGCGDIPASQRRSSARPNHTTWTTRSPRWDCS